jgi:hypothetical protein
MDNRQKAAIGGAVPMVFRQIAVTTAIGPDGGEVDRLVGLAEDGSVWEYRSEFSRFAKEQDKVNAHGHHYKCTGEMIYWWHPLRMSADKGPESEPPPVYVQPK